MNLKKLVGEHTIDADLLPEEPLVLDAGCRTFNFCEEILTLRPKARILAFDPGPDILTPTDTRIFFLRFALIESDQARVWLKMNECSSIVSMEPRPYLVEVSAIPFRTILSVYGPHFDLIKFDIEGCEFEILKNWPGPCATQINIEFHDNMVSEDKKALPESYFERLFAEKLPDYEVVQNPPDYLGVHTDCLLVLKKRE